jgi:DnaJ-class molecular chaperone
MPKTNIICPRCGGNGYIKIPNQEVGVPKEVVTQCSMCGSKGEIDAVDIPNNVDSNDKLQ